MLREVIKVGTTASKGLFFLGRIETGMGDLVREAHPSLLLWRNIDVRFLSKQDQKRVVVLLVLN